MSDERDELNRVLHAGAKPCRTACMHVIAGRWTALGIANVLSRVDDSPAAPGGADQEDAALALLREMPPLDQVADWLDTFDRMGTVFLAAIDRSDLTEQQAANLRGAVATVEGDDVQRDLRAFAAKVAALLAGAPSTDPAPEPGDAT